VHHKKHLGFAALRKSLSKHFRQIDDRRQTAKVDYRLHDCLMSGFAMMFFQDPSVLTFQQRLQDGIQKNNLTTIFDVRDIPKDTQMRSVLDAIFTSELDGIFADFLHRLQRGKHLANYRFFDGSYLLSIDGSQYFSSEKICCPHCLVTTSKGHVRYHHQILQSVIVDPNKRQVLPLAPEAISNRDGTKKQDCERNAAKRLVTKIRATYPKLKITVTADGLYSNQPFIDELKAARMSFILVAKPADHKLLFEWVNELMALGDGGSLELGDQKGRRPCYQWVNQVALNGTKDADLVNFFQYQLVAKPAKSLIKTAG